MKVEIPFNKPYLSGNELLYIEQAVQSGEIAGNQYFTKKCQDFLETRYGFGKCLLTTSCTDALEMCALLLDIGPGDEIIMPSYTFVSTANAFALRGATIRFADVSETRPALDPGSVKELINERTKAIVLVHYAGIACEMDEFRTICDEHRIALIEDAAQAIDSSYISDGRSRSLGSIGDLATFSFHETKNIISGEGGALVINNPVFKERAEIIWEKGTNRAAFARGEIDKYSWIDLGSSFLPGELTSAYLFAQLENIEQIQARRKDLWDEYFKAFSQMNLPCSLPVVPDHSTNNHHIFYLCCRTGPERDELIDKLQCEGILAIYHYVPLHTSPYFSDKHDGRILRNTDRFASTLVRLPLYYELSELEQKRIIDSVAEFYSA